MKKIARRISPVSVACTAQQLYMLGTYNSDGTVILQTQASVCYLPGSPCPESGDLYKWYESQDAKKFSPLLYSFKYYTLSKHIGQLDAKDL